MRRKNRKSSNSVLPSFVEKISLNIEETIDNIQVGNFSEFSKGEEILQKHVGNFIFFEE